MTTAPDFGSLVDLYERYRTGYSEELYATIRERASDEPRVLDLAAGTGISSEPLQAHARRFVAMDIAPRMLERAPIRDRVLAQAEALPFAEGSFDLVTCAQAFHWFDPQPAYEQIHHVLVPKGIAVIWWKYPVEGDEVREITDEAIEAIVGRTPPHTPLVEGPLPDVDEAPFEAQTLSLPFTMTYTLDDWVGYQASRRILRDEAADEDEHVAVLEAVEQRLREAYPDGELAVDYVQHLHLLSPR